MFSYSNTPGFYLPCFNLPICCANPSKLTAMTQIRMMELQQNIFQKSHENSRDCFWVLIMGSLVSSKTSVPPPQVFVLSSMETGRGAPWWKEEKEAGDGPGEEVTFQLPSLIPQKEDMSVVLHNRPQEEASLWCILVMESFNGLSRKSLEQSNLKKPRLLLCIRKQ